MTDRRELEEFCRQVYPPVCRAVALHCGDRELAEESTQEALLRACATWRTVRGLANPSGWVFRVAANLTADHHRRRAARDRAYRMLAGRAPAVPPAAADDRVDLMRALRALPPKQRQVVVMKFYLDMPAQEIGAALGMSAGAVRATRHRAVSRLKTALQPPATHLPRERTHVL